MYSFSLNIYSTITNFIEVDDNMNSFQKIIKFLNSKFVLLI